MLADRNTFARDKQLIAAMTPSWMTWAIHLGRNDTLDGDNFFLHIQVCRYIAWIVLEIDYVSCNPDALAWHACYDARHNANSWMTS